MASKKITAEQVSNVLGASENYFTRERTVDAQDPLEKTPMKLPIEQVKTYDRNPRRSKNPEYDTISLLKEYKRDVNLYIDGELEQYPPMPDNYFSHFSAAVFREYRYRVDQSLQKQAPVPEFPEHLVLEGLRNTWQDTASAVVGEWIGLIYQYTNVDRRKPFMDGLDMDNPLGL